MAEKASNEAEEAEGAGPGESFLDQLLRRFDQSADQDSAGTVSPSTSSSMALPAPEYSSNNPWPFSSQALNPDLQPAALHSLLYGPGSSVAASLNPANPLAEFPWLFQEFDHPRPGLDSRLADQRLYSSSQYAPPQDDSQQQQQQLALDQLPVQAEPKRKEPRVTGGHGSGSSSSKLDAARVPLFVESSGHFSDPGSAAQGARQVINYRPPTSPLLSEATAGGAGGSVTTSAGTSNTSVSSGSTSNAGDEDESSDKKQQQQLQGESSSGLKRKKPEPGAPSDTLDQSKKLSTVDPPKSKPRKRGVAKRLREPRYAIKTRTDVDVLDDGFKWRKYGQKAVKNSPHPRNYYRCTTPSCPVRKRVERSNEDAGLVITTYEGTHSHQTPGLHRPAGGGYFGDRPLGMGLFQSPLGPGGANLLPLPPGFDLASLQQANALRTMRGLQPNPSFPPSFPPHHHMRQQLGLQQESLLRAQQFLGLQDPAFGSVKQEPFHFTAQQADSSSSFMPRSNLLQQQQQQPPGPSHSLLTRSISDHPLQRPLFTAFPISGPASSSNITPPDRREIHLPGASSRIDQSLETLVSSSSGRPNFEDRSDQPPSMSTSSHSIILGSGSLDPRGQQRTPMQPQQRNIRSGLSSESLHGQGSESSTLGQQQQQQQQPEGLLQDMVRHGVPKVSKS